MKNEDAEYGANSMRQSGEMAAVEAKLAMVKSVEENLREEDSPKNAGRQIGAIITATTILYADMIATCVRHYEETGLRKEAELAAGMLAVLAKDSLTRLTQITEGK